MPIQSTWVVIKGKVAMFPPKNKFYMIVCKNKLDKILSSSFVVLE